MVAYLSDAERDTTGFDAEEAWVELSGLQGYRPRISRAKDIQDPILRLLHKLISYSFLHRDTHHDKCYTEDLWCLHAFSARDPTRFVNVPWALARYMAEKGEGQTDSSKMLCGHFITRIARTLGLATPANIQQCSQAVHCKVYGQADMLRVGLLHPGGRRLAAFGRVDEVAQAQAPVQRQRALPQQEFQDQVLAGLHRLQFDNVQSDRRWDHFQRREEYFQERYQPSWEYIYQQQHPAPYPPFDAPAYYYPEPYPGYHPAPPQDQEESDEE